METRIRNGLIQIARSKRYPVAYSTLIHQTELGLNLDISHEKALLSQILDEISEREHAAGRPLLSAMVKAKANIGQGDNFFKLCERLGMGEWRELKRDPQFIKTQRRICHKFWVEEENFAQFA